MNTAERYLPAAQRAAKVIAATLAERGLDPAISRYILTQTGRGSTWLFAVLDVPRLARLENYMTGDVIHHLSTALQGLPVVISNSSGLRYAVLLSPPPRLAKMIPFPGWRAGLAQLGVSVHGQPVGVRWEELGHMLIGGMSGSGKSNLLRLLVAQAAQDGLSLALADPDGRTFPQLEEHPALICPLGRDLESCYQVLESVLGEITRRNALYDAMPGYPDSLDSYNASAAPGERLARLLVVVDEYNGLVQATGGARASLAQAATQIAWRGRKFGVTLILAGQEFNRDVVGPARDQLTTRICFRVANAGVSRLILNRSGAENLRTPGRAWSNVWGLLQAYSAGDLLTPQPAGDGLTREERELARRLLGEFGGRLTYEALAACGYTRRAADRLRGDWLARGLAERGPADNALVLRAGLGLDTNRQGEQTGQTRTEGVQTGLQAG